jgi:hypothetical protein
MVVDSDGTSTFAMLAAADAATLIAALRRAALFASRMKIPGGGWIGQSVGEKCGGKSGNYPFLYPFLPAKHRMNVGEVRHRRPISLCNPTECRYMVCVSPALGSEGCGFEFLPAHEMTRFPCAAYAVPVFFAQLSGGCL